VNNFSNLLDGKRVLHFAPEPWFSKMLRGSTSEYTTADYLQEGCDLKLDMCAMPEIADHSLDTLIACDVLEHVPSESAALREIQRVLRPGGTAILTVPEANGLDSKFELPIGAPPEEMLEKCGQIDHQRIYGRDDFGKILKDAGFLVEIRDHTNISEKAVQKLCLFPPVLSEHHLATNQRHIYFATNE